MRPNDTSGGRTTSTANGVGHIAPSGVAIDRDVPRIGLSREEAAIALSVSPRAIDTLIADRTSGFPVARVGTRVVVPIRELTEWLADRIQHK